MNKLEQITGKTTIKEISHNDIVRVFKDELIWLINCTDVQMLDGDTARELARFWANGQTGQMFIDEIERDFPTY